MDGARDTGTGGERPRGRGPGGDAGGGSGGPGGGGGVGGGGVGGGVTLGVEEEFLLVDAVSGECVPRAERVLEAAGEHPWRGAGGAFHPELLTSQVEAATGVCGDLAALREQLRAGRARLAAAARAAGARLVSAGTPVLDGPPPPPARGDRFAAVTAAYGEVVEDYQACGCHVHVGVPDRETAVAVVNHLRPWLATLVALAANSAFDHGRALTPRTPDDRTPDDQDRRAAGRPVSRRGCRGPRPGAGPAARSAPRWRRCPTRRSPRRA